MAGRLADAQTPITKSASNIFAAIATVLPAFCKVEIGTWIAIVWQLNLATPSLPAFLNPPKSKAPPKSTKNGSSTGPQNTFSPEVEVVTAAVMRAA